jgi:hypothetical protein
MVITARNNKKWSELTARHKGHVVLRGFFRFTSLTGALVDDGQRSAEEIEGHGWQGVRPQSANPVSTGPIACYVCGWRR